VSEERLRPQLPILWDVLALCGVPVVAHHEFEAEDIIGTLAAREHTPVAIFSGDRDLFQLVADPDVWVLYPRRGTSDLIRVDEAYVAEHYGIPPRAYADFAVLRGDASDGLPGVVGIGEKMAAAIVARYGSLDAALAAVDKAGAAAAGPLGKIRRDRDYVERARRVVKIRTDVPVPDADLTRHPAPGGEDLWTLADRHGLTSPVRRLVEALARP
jgi:5'-3' exonuclease